MKGIQCKEEEDEYLVTFKETFPQFMNSLSDNILPRISKTFQIGSLQGISLTATREYIGKMKRNEYVKDIIPNFKVDALAGDDDGNAFTVQEGAPRHLARLSSARRLPFDFDDVTRYKTQFNYYYPSWNVGSGVRAYILDTGVDAEHAEFEQRVESGYDCTGEGFGDYNGHGTHVAGIVGSRTFGVAKNVTLVDVKCLDGRGQGTLMSVITALEWVVNDCHEHQKKKNNNNATGCVANLSLGSLKTQILNDAIEEAVKNGVLIVVAAGNYNMNACWVSPASSPEAITVGAFDDRLDSIAKFSNWGPCVDIFAPGVSIASVVSSQSGNDTKRKLLQRYVAYSGTSMASPSVCGLVALMLEEGVSADKIKGTLLERSVEDVFHRRTLVFKPNTPNRVAYNGVVQRSLNNSSDKDHYEIDLDVLVKELNEYSSPQNSKNHNRRKPEAVRLTAKDGRTKIVYLDNDLCLPNCKLGCITY